MRSPLNNGINKTTQFLLQLSFLVDCDWLQLILSECKAESWGAWEAWRLLDRLSNKANCRIEERKEKQQLNGSSLRV